MHRTRGVGLLEPLLASWRARKANEMILQHLRSGRILDIGCGSYPYFLAHTAFKEKFAVEQLPLGKDITSKWEIEFFNINLNANPVLPFETDFFSVVTLLAVVEHLNPGSMARLLRDIYRVIKPGGSIVLTTPAAWSDHLLRWMSHLRLVSSEEIDEHVYAYTLPLIGWYFGQAGFEMEKIKFGYFEFGLNMWATAVK